MIAMIAAVVVAWLQQLPHMLQGTSVTRRRRWGRYRPTQNHTNALSHTTILITLWRPCSQKPCIPLSQCLTATMTMSMMVPSTENLWKVQRNVAISVKGKMSLWKQQGNMHWNVFWQQIPTCVSLPHHIGGSISIWPILPSNRIDWTMQGIIFGGCANFSSMQVRGWLEHSKLEEECGNFQNVPAFSEKGCDIAC